MTEILFQPLGNPTAAGLGLEKTADIDPRLTRTNYFDGRLLTAEDLTRDQVYLDQRLRELGRILGNGVMNGLELSLDKFTGILTLQPGKALTYAGRVLELGTPLTVSLRDRALISNLNSGRFNTLNRGLYAVVLRYADVGTDIAEVFPKDLGARRGQQYGVITECVQMGLVPLPFPLANQDQLQIRARLMREFLGDDSLRGLLPEDAVALGLVAIQDGAPRWLDAELLRHPVRAEADMDDIQADLSRQYETLLADVRASRESGGHNGDFHAGDYFSLIPPVGTLPKAAVDPVRGYQGFFPENYKVHIAPIRQADVELIKSESLALPPIDLKNGEPVDVVVLVPLSNLDYGHYAAALERTYDPTKRVLPQIDLLRLKLYPVRPVHALDTDAGAWQAIWDRLGDNSPLYVRRPSRAAETSVSAIVLARGTALPEPPLVEPNPADNGGVVVDETEWFTQRFNYKLLAELRPPVNDDGAKALEKLIELFSYPFMIELATKILTRVERQYDAVIWQTLLVLADGSQLETFLTGLQKAEPEASTGKVAIKLGEELKLGEDLLKQWDNLLS